MTGDRGGFGSASFGGLGRLPGGTGAGVSGMATTSGGGTVSGGGVIGAALLGAPNAASARAR